MRRDANEVLKVQLKDKEITEDDQEAPTEKVQKETDAGVAKVDEIDRREGEGGDGGLSAARRSTCSQFAPAASGP